MSDKIENKTYCGEDSYIVFKSYGETIVTDRESIAKAFEK